MSSSGQPSSSRLSSVESQSSSRGPQRTSVSANHTSTSAPAQNLPQAQPYSPDGNMAPPDSPGFPMPSYQAPDGTPLFTKKQFQGELDRQCYEYRRDADILGADFKTAQAIITSQNAEMEKAQTVQTALAASKKTCDDLTADKVKLSAQLEQANTQIVTQSHRYEQEMTRRTAEVDAMAAEKLNQQVRQVRAFYQAGGAGDMNQRPMGDAEVTALRAEVATVKQQVTTMRAACVQQLGNQRVQHDHVLASKDQEISGLEASQQASQSQQLAAKDREIAGLRSASDQRFSQQLAVKDKEIASLKAANAQVTDAGKRPVTDGGNALRREQALRAEEKRQLEHQITQHKQDIQRLKDELKLKDLATKELIAERGEILEQKDQELRVLNGHLDALQQKKPATEAETRQLLEHDFQEKSERRAKRMSNEFSKSRAEIAELKEEIVKLKAEHKEQMEASDERIAGLEADILEHKADMETLRAEVQSEKQAAQSQKEVSDAKIESLELKFKRAKEGLADHEHRAKRLKTEVKAEKDE